MASTAMLLVGIIVIVLVISGAVVLLAPQQPKVQPTTTHPLSTTTAPSTSGSSSTTTTQSTITTTTITIQSNVTDAFLMPFLTCSGSGCNNPQNHTTYLAQSNDGINWTLVNGFRPYKSSVPDLVRKGAILYIYNPGTVTTYNINTGVESSQKIVTLKYQNGTASAGFVDPAPILVSNGSIILFYLPAIIGHDPAGCPVPPTPCTKYIDSATEVPGSNGTEFTINPGYRVGVRTNATASDPAIFQGPSGYILYVSEGQGVVAFSSQQLIGNYTPIQGLPNAVLVAQGIGGVPNGYYNSATGKYWTYVSYTSPSSVGYLKLAITKNITSQISSSYFNKTITGCDFQALGCSITIESPGFYPNLPNATR